MHKYQIQGFQNSGRRQINGIGGTGRFDLWPSALCVN